MGKAYVDELLPDRHALLMQMQGYVAASDPEIQAHVRGCFGGSSPRSRELSGADAGRGLALLRARDAAQRHRRARPRGDRRRERVGGELVRRHAERRSYARRLARLIDRRRRPVLASPSVVRACSPPARSAARSSACSTSATTSRTPARSRSWRATRSSGPPGARPSPDAVVLVRLGAQVGTPQAQAQARGASRGALRGPRRRRGRRVRERRAVAAGLRGPPLDLPARHLLHRRRRGRGGRARSRSACAREPGVTVGGGQSSPSTRSASRSRPTSQRAEMLAAPLLFLFSLLVFRSLVAALLPLAVGDDDDPASRSPGCGSSTSSSRCRCSRST